MIIIVLHVLESRLVLAPLCSGTLDCNTVPFVLFFVCLFVVVVFVVVVFVVFVFLEINEEKRELQKARPRET